MIIKFKHNLQIFRYPDFSEKLQLYLDCTEIESSPINMSVNKGNFIYEETPS